MSRMLVRTLALLALCTLVVSIARASAQGVTTAEMTGLVKDAQGAAIPGATVTAVHEPSGTTYLAVSQADGRFFIPAMRVGGPYRVTATLSGFKDDAKKDIMLNLGVAQDLSFTLSVQGVTETVTVVGEAAAVFSSNRTGAATAVTRDDLNQLPTVAGRINDITRLAPQAGSNGSFAGQDSKLNNITVDGSYFNNSFGLQGQPGDRTGVAPISLEAVEQIQVSIAPYDVRQGNFVGAGVNVVTRSGTNKLTGSYYSRYRNQSFLGKEARGFAFNPGTFTTKTNGAFLGGAIVKNKLFAFGSFEKQSDVRPLTNFRANQGGEAVGGSVTRVLASDLDALSAFLKSNFNYDTGPYNNISGSTPAKPFLVKGDYNINTKNRVNFRYSQLSSSADKLLSGSSSAGVGRGSGNSTNFLGFANSNYSQLENFKSGIGEWNSVIGDKMSNNVIVGYTTNNESRGTPKFFPFVDILDGAGTAYTSFGSDPFTRNNELYYHTFQLQDSFTRFARSHTLTAGFSAEKYHSDNVFFQLSNGAFTYNTLADFYADANAYLANKNRTTQTVPLRRYQLGYMNVPDLDKPLQQIDSWYIGAYAQDQWAMRPNVSITAGLRVDTPFLNDKTTFPNPVADALVFRDENGQPVQYNTGNLPDPKPLWSPRLGFNWDVLSDQKLQVRGGTGVFTGKPAYVWLSNQIGNTGLLLGGLDDNNLPAGGATFRGFNPDTLAYKPVVTGASAASYALNVTDPNFKFPQVWRSNIAVDKQLPFGLIATGEIVYNRDINGVYYINANLPAPQGSFTGVDTRPRWVGTTCSAAGNKGGCVTRINAEPGNVVLQNFVLKNENVGSSWVASGALTKSFFHGFTAKTAYSYGESRNTVDAGSTASGTFNGIAQATNPNSPGLGFSQNSPGHRVFLNLSYTKQYFGLGATTVSAFWEARTNSNNFATNGSYVFAGDMNGDSISNNDLIYIPRDTSEMNFVAIPATATTRAFTVAEEVDAFEAYIKQDAYLSKHRGEYAARNAVFLPLVKRMDLSITQDVFGHAAGAKHTGQVRLDVTNFGNLLNHNWGVGQRFTVPSSSTSLNLVPILTNVTVDAAGKYSYRMAVINNALAATTFSTTTFSNDVYTMMLSFRYNFN